MDRQYYIDLAEHGLRMPIGTDMVLREKEDHEAILHDGARLGAVVAEAARRYRTPLAVPLMDLMLEKATLLDMLDVPTADIPTYHFHGHPGAEALAAVERRIGEPFGARLQANVDAVRYVTEKTDLLPIGMTIGPFSLMTKLIADPITPVYLAGAGATAADEPEVAAVEAAMEMGLRVILRSVEAQIAAGARAIMVAEPAANKVYFSPKQLDKGSDVFERYALAKNRRIQELLARHGVDLLFHCCGELTDGMVKGFTTLRPVVLSLGSSRVLWDDARIVPKDVVLFGNLPSKRFYSDDLVTSEQVGELACELIARMRAAGHPFILGSECDVLSVPGCHDSIAAKVDAFVHCSC